MAAVCNFLGVFLMSMLNATVAETITKMVDFGENSYEAIVALCAALFAIVLWATLAWAFGIPTSESHALIAGLTGAAIAVHGGLQGVNGSEWIKVIYGMVLSVVLGFGRLHSLRSGHHQPGLCVCQGVRNADGGFADDRDGLSGPLP